MNTKIQVWSDFVCPFCYIGKRHLETAIEELGLQNVEVELMSYELDPHASQEFTETIYDHLSKKYDMSLAEAKASTDGVSQMARNVGLVFDFEHMKPSNTFRVHRVFQLAKEHGKGNEFAELVMDSFFAKGVFINEDAVIFDFAKQVGLVESDVKNALSDDGYAYRVRQDIQHGSQLGLRGVPFFVINDTTIISGAQPISVFKDALTKTSSEQNEALMCESDACLL